MTSRDERAVAGLEGLSKKGRSLLVLAYMARVGEPIGMSEFTRASTLVPEMARSLRDVLLAMGLIESRVASQRGVVEIQEITLTPLGGRVAGHVLDIEAILDEAAQGPKSRARAARTPRRPE